MQIDNVTVRLDLNLSRENMGIRGNGSVWTRLAIGPPAVEKK
jgi:hypothetical protein